MLQIYPWRLVGLLICIVVSGQPTLPLKKNFEDALASRVVNFCVIIGREAVGITVPFQPTGDMKDRAWNFAYANARDFDGSRHGVCYAHMCLRAVQGQHHLPQKAGVGSVSGQSPEFPGAAHDFLALGYISPQSVDSSGPLASSPAHVGSWVVPCICCKGIMP